MFNDPDPFTGWELAKALHTVDRNGSAYLSTLTNEQFFARQGQYWSPAEHLRHVRKSNATITMALRIPQWFLRVWYGIPEVRRPRDYGVVRSAYLSILAAGGQAGRYAPSPERPPANPPVRRATIMRSWRAANASLARGVERWSEDALDMIRLPHPLMGLILAREMVSFAVYHTAHHLSRIRERSDQWDGQERRRNSLR